MPNQAPLPAAPKPIARLAAILAALAPRRRPRRVRLY
jgi:hypothetical protein